MSSEGSEQINLAFEITKPQTKSDTLINCSPRANTADSEMYHELLSHVACLNEQAIKEINANEDAQDLETGQHRLHKAFKIVNEAQNSHFDSNYKAVINYNLACSY